MKPERAEHRGVTLKLAILWLAILLLGSFLLTMKGTPEPVSMSVLPQVPREGEPVIAIFRLNNPSSSSLPITFQFYANGKLLKDGDAIVAPSSAIVYKYAYENGLEIGSQLNFMVRTQSELGNYEKVLSTPGYPPQVWSSFVSFASFSTSLMSSFSSMSYFVTYFQSFQSTSMLGGVGAVGLNAGVIFAIVLIGLLAFLEITRPMMLEKNMAVLGRLKLRFGTVTWILLIIFLGIVYTKVVMILVT